MSTYASVGGTIRYNSREAFDKAMALLTSHWLDKDGKFHSEYNSGAINDEQCIFPDDLRIVIPEAYYRNLENFIPTLFENGVGRVVWTSTDGQFVGGVYTRREKSDKLQDVLYSLEDWFKSQVSPEDTTNPESEDYIPNVETEFEEYCQWQEEVQNDFFEEFSNP